MTRGRAVTYYLLRMLRRWLLARGRRRLLQQEIAMLRAKARVLEEIIEALRDANQAHQLDAQAHGAEAKVYIESLRKRSAA